MTPIQYSHLSKSPITILSSYPPQQLVDGSQTLSLKSKNCLEAAGKAELSIETRLVFNVLRASVRTVNPREAKVLQQPDKFNRKLLVSNARRLASLIRTIVTLVQFANGLFSWENRVHSALALVVSEGVCGASLHDLVTAPYWCYFSVSWMTTTEYPLFFLQAFVWGCLFFDYWMAPAALIAVFIVEYCVVSAQTRRTKSQKHFVLGVECSEVRRECFTCSVCVYIRTYIRVYSMFVFVCMYEAHYYT